MLKLEKLTDCVAGYTLHVDAFVIGVPLIRTDPPTVKFTLLVALIAKSGGNPNTGDEMDDAYILSAETCVLPML